MAATRTRIPNYRADDPGLAPSPSLCSCGETFPNLNLLFGHDCPADVRTSRSLPTDVPTVPTDDVNYRRYGQGQGSGRATAAPATEKQMRLLGKLASERGLSVPDGLSKRKASALIDEWLKSPAARPTGNVRPNRYAARCEECKGNVPEGEGSLTKGPTGRWETRHVGSCPVVAPAPEATPEVPEVPAGNYALPSSGSNDLAFYRVDRPTEGRWAGYVFVKRVVGGQPDSRVPRSQVSGILARIAADDEAGPRYGREIGRCYVCNRTLTDEPSRAAGIGPVCASL